MKKNLISLLLCLMLTITISGCDKKESDSPGKDKNSEEVRSIQIGDYSLKYGRYKNDYVDITLNIDNTCIYKTADQNIYDCTYEIKSYSEAKPDNTYTNGYNIIFYIKGLNDFYFNITGNNEFTDLRAPVQYEDE